MVQTVPMLPADSVAAWELEATFKTAPAAAGWRPFGELPEWTDLGPRNALVADRFAGSGREPHRITPEGRSFDTPIGPFAIVDPRLLAVAWGQETTAPVVLSGAFTRHTANPTTRGRLASISIQMKDKQGAAEAAPVTDKSTWLGCVLRRASLMGRRVNPDGSGGQIMGIVEPLAFNEDPTIADKTATLLNKAPFRYSMGNLTFWGEQLFRVLEWEFQLDNQAAAIYTHQDTGVDYPYEPVHDGAAYRFNATIAADGEKFTTGGGVDKLIREISRERLLGNVTLKYVRVASQEEFQINITDLMLAEALKRRSRGPGQQVEYRITGEVTASTFQWVDDSAGVRFLSS